jgi:hypothetical protein
MALKWHHKNISNKITIFIEFWRLPSVLFDSFDCDYTFLEGNSIDPYQKMKLKRFIMVWKTKM